MPDAGGVHVTQHVERRAPPVALPLGRRREHGRHGNPEVPQPIGDADQHGVSLRQPGQEGPVGLLKRRPAASGVVEQ